MPHHPHIHVIAPGGGISPDGKSWLPCRPNFFLHVRVLSHLFRRLFLEKLSAAHEAGRLRFFNDLAHLSEPDAFAAYLAPWRDRDWVVHAQKPFAGPETVLAYLARYTHRVAISNSRLISCDERGVTFTYKDYRRKGRKRHATMTLTTDEFIHRFLLHVLPSRFHRIRHYGLFANSRRAANLARARELLAMAPDHDTYVADISGESGDEPSLAYPCPACGGAMVIIERFEPGARPRAPPPARAEAA